MNIQKIATVVAILAVGYILGVKFPQYAARFGI